MQWGVMLADMLTVLTSKAGETFILLFYELIYNEPLFNPAKDYCSPVVRSFGDPGRDFSFQVCLRIALRRTPLNLKHISIKNVE